MKRKTSSKECSRGHAYVRTTTRPYCPYCYPGYYNKEKFAERVRKVVKSIPKGKTMSYGLVAARAGKPGAARAVGSIMKNNDDPSVPCHRVVRADGKPTGYNGINGPSREVLLAKERAQVPGKRK
jgi:methylated-DNA-[protein]-cysteine S-methyltransferase